MGTHGRAAMLHQGRWQKDDGARDSESQTKIEGKLEKAHDSSADAKQTKRWQEEMKKGTCKLMSAQTQTPLPRLDSSTNERHPPSASFATLPAASSSHRRGLILRRMAQTNVLQLKSEAKPFCPVWPDRSHYQLRQWKTLLWHNSRNESGMSHTASPNSGLQIMLAYFYFIL